MKAFVELNSAPIDEDCVQVDATENYLPAMIQECHIYLRQLYRLFPMARLGIKKFSHDFGSYVEAVVYYDDASEAEEEAAWAMQDNLPLLWDDEAKKELIAAKWNAIKKEMPLTSEEFLTEKYLGDLVLAITPKVKEDFLKILNNIEVVS